jgi:4-hydroxy-3-polyprenylbenzoate decarboxylase
MSIQANQRLVVAVTGASGAIYAVRLLKAGLEMGLEIDLVASDYGRRLLFEECDLNLKTTGVGDWLDRRFGAEERPGRVRLHREQDLGAGIASGSQQWAGMVVIPCSMKTLSGIAGGHAANLIERAADVTLKERRPLVLVPRETPLNLIQLENLTRVARAGAIVVPAMPAFYYGPQSFDDLADFIVGRVFSVLGIPHNLFRAWKA